MVRPNPERKRSENKPRGRPVTKALPPPIEAIPEQIAEVVLQAKPKQTWRYLQDDTPHHKP